MPSCGMHTKSKIVCAGTRSEEHTSELQSQSNLVCRLLLEKKNKKNYIRLHTRSPPTFLVISLAGVSFKNSDAQTQCRTAPIIPTYHAITSVLSLNHCSLIS